MFCYNCGCHLSEHDFCTACGVDVSLYKKILAVSNVYYNEGLDKASVRDLMGAVTSLRQSLKFNKNNIEARNLLGLVYFETGEVVAALSEWVISKNLRPEKNIADDYINRVQSNASRLESINQTIKKYNQALAYCEQESKDLAIIQLKKVLSLNPRFIRAHQLLALLYMDIEEWERAERELRKCMDIDRNNIQTLRYLREVEQMMIPDDAVNQPSKRKKEEVVRYQSDNELIIQPVNMKQSKGSGVSTLVNLGLGLLLGVAVTYFLIVPAAQSNAKKEQQDTIAKISNESDGKTVRIQELEAEIKRLTQSNEDLNRELEGIVGTDGTLQNIDSLLAAATTYLETGDVEETAASLNSITQSLALEEASEEFMGLYRMLLLAIGPEMSETYYNEGMEAVRIEDFPAAIESLARAVFYDETNEDALYQLARAYHRNNDVGNAIATYDRVIELFPGSSSARYAGQYRDELSDE